MKEIRAHIVLIILTLSAISDVRAQKFCPVIAVYGIREYQADSSAFYIDFDNKIQSLDSLFEKNVDVMLARIVLQPGTYFLGEVSRKTQGLFKAEFENVYVQTLACM